jgi:hypothetical protein
LKTGRRSPPFPPGPALAGPLSRAGDAARRGTWGGTRRSTVAGGATQIAEGPGAALAGPLSRAGDAACRGTWGGSRRSTVAGGAMQLGEGPGAALVAPLSRAGRCWLARCGKLDGPKTCHAEPVEASPFDRRVIKRSAAEASEDFE